ncbi:MAG TPA: ATP-dependent DNA helicase [Terriglobales bacterium]|nr:ATP-dependent DNA helicase [Terriglobales bacterium]
MPAVFDDKQLAAIEHVHGPMLVVAGAGTGKTTVLVQRIVRLIQNGHAAPQEILAVTYTDNAAKELKQRVLSEAEKLGLWKPNQDFPLRACTFHAFCNGILHRTGNKFDVVTNEDLFVYLRRRLRELPLKHFIRAASPAEFLSHLLKFFDRCDDELVSVERYEQYVAALCAGALPLPRVSKSREAATLAPAEVIARCREIAAVYRSVRDMLAAENLGTFGQMISRAVSLLQADSGILAAERRKARFLLIDEFQDSNPAQIRIARLLGGEEQNVFAVGDPDQAIYRFRGATNGVFEIFERCFTGVKRVTLVENRRSLAPILQAAFCVIDMNPPAGSVGEPRQPLRSAREREAVQQKRELRAEPVDLVRVPKSGSAAAEAAAVANAIQRMRSGCRGHRVTDATNEFALRGCQWNDFALLYRSHGHREALIRELKAQGIPFAVQGANILEATDVRDVMAAFRAVSNPSDGISLFRLAALPQFRIDGERLRSALASAADTTTLPKILEKVPGGKEVLARLNEAINLSGLHSEQTNEVLEIVLHVLSIPESETIQAFRNFVSNWHQKAITRSGTLDEFLEYLDFYEEAGGAIPALARDTDDSVQLMTAHSAKGLEFAHIFIIRVCAGSFPAHYREVLFEFPQALREPALQLDEDPKQSHNQEERRLAYVAMTRACDTLALYGTRGKGREADPPGIMRNLAQEKSLTEVIHIRDADACSGSSWAPESDTKLASWLALPPRSPLQQMSLSATRIESYQRCPLRFKIENDWRIPDQPAPAMQYGNAVHTALKAYSDSLQQHRPLTRQVFLQCFLDAFSGMYFEDEHQAGLYRNQGLEQLGEFFDLQQAQPPVEVLASEHVFDFQIGGIRVKGRIDRVDRTADGAICLVDYKTGSPRDEEDADKSLQLSIYAMAAQKEWGKLPERIGFHNLTTNRLVETERDEKELALERDKISEVAEGIRAGRFDAKPGRNCHWCPYYSLCPETEEKIYSIAAVGATS